ncbi:PepSY domain-containing protein [Halalkalibacter urbisdiaboli]|uniref:PepSY domain-containing protein n=1 Tax=Halalkalibacter urbisdiaboli TaxID=1960589 RepID=UPI000B44AD42|nr:PepSY domain-containing protein [Halalkalibacter urbisdiaboli]
MGMKRFIFGVGLGIAAGYILRPTLSDRITPEKALKQVKKTLSQTYAITGSWIQMIPETIERHQVTYDVYRGGVSTTSEQGTTQYEFTIDTKTGTILDLIES